MEWKNLYRGFLMGVSDLIPGVSGGTIALLLGIYDQLLKSISGFFSRDWRKHLSFLLPLAIGMGLALFSLSKVIAYLLKHQQAPTQFFFVGLIVGIIPFIAKQARIRKNFRARHVMVILLTAVALACTAFMKPNDMIPITNLTPINAIGLFFAGWAGSAAMLLPGISGSFILLLLGVYSTAITALSNFNVPIILVIGLGVLVGFKVSSKIIAECLEHFRSGMFAIILGLVIGSIFVIYPGIPESGTPYVMSVIALITGLLVATTFSQADK